MLLPSLFWPDSELPEIYQNLPLDHLPLLLARGRRRMLGDTFEQVLASAFHHSGKLATAVLTLGLDRLEPHGHYWLRADPVHLQVNRAELILRDSAFLELAQHEADAVVATLNRHFADDGLLFHAPQPARWYVELAIPPQMEAPALSEVIGKDIHENLPTGQDAMRWHRWLNEIQMLLYDHPVNQAREVSGAPALNSIWFWGGGAALPALRSRHDAIWAEDELTQAMAIASGLQSHAIPTDADAWLSRTSRNSKPLIVLPRLREAAQQSDAYAWREYLQLLDRHWFGPLTKALREDAITSLQIIAPEVARWDIGKRDLWKVWRRPKFEPGA